MTWLWVCVILLNVVNILDGWRMARLDARIKKLEDR